MKSESLINWWFLNFFSPTSSLSGRENKIKNKKLKIGARDKYSGQSMVCVWPPKDHLQHNRVSYPKIAGCGPVCNCVNITGVTRAALNLLEHNKPRAYICYIHVLALFSGYLWPGGNTLCRPGRWLKGLEYTPWTQEFQSTQWTLLSYRKWSQQ